MPPLSPHPVPLPAGRVLDVYRFERLLGHAGTFGMTYSARDLRNGARVAIKELFPADFVRRDAAGRVVVSSAADETVFIETMKMFRREADVLSRVKHPNVVRVFDYLEANGTGYMVMGYEEGYDLRIHLEKQRPGRLNENELKKLLLPLLDGLEAVHDLHYLHRDIKPSNIYLTRGHQPLLLDFGAARQMAAGATRRVEQILTPPFAPIEQYGQTSSQGPYTDIYALGVVAFCAMLAHERFPHAPDRQGADVFQPLRRRLRGQEYSDEFLAAVDWALQVRAPDRPQTVRQWRQALERSPRRRPSRGVFASFTSQVRRFRKGTAGLFWQKWGFTIALALGFVLLTLLLTFLLFPS